MEYEKINRWQLLIGWGILILYCTGLCQKIPILNNMFFIIEIIFIILFIPILFQSLKDFKINLLKNLLLVFLGFIIIFALSNIILPTIMQWFNISMIEDTNTKNLIQSFNQNPIFYTFGILFLGPILEEIVYRMICFGSLYGKNKTLAHFTTALLFGLQHIAIAVLWNGNLSQIFNIFNYIIFSFVLTIIYEKKKNIIFPIGIHFINNLFSLLFVLFIK